MPKGDHLLISDELENWIANHAGEPERVGRLVVALVSVWRNGGRPPDSVAPDIADLAEVFGGQIVGFGEAVARGGGMTPADRREYKRRTVANSRARRRGEPEPYPDPKAGLPSCQPLPCCQGNSGNNGNSGQHVATAATMATQGNASQTTCECAPARTREGGPLGMEEARAIGAAAGLPAREVDAWWDYYEALDWAPSAKAGPNARMSREAAIASIRKWQRNRALYGDSGRPRRGAAARPASAIRDLTETTDAEKAESEARHGW